MIPAFSGAFSLQGRSAVPSAMGGGEFQFEIGEGAEVMFAANADTGCRRPVRVQAASTVREQPRGQHPFGKPRRPP